MPYFTEAARLLIEVIFNLAGFVFLLRLLLQWRQVSFHNPLCQSLYRLTHPVLAPLRRLLRSWRRIDLAAAAVLLLLMLFKALLLLWLATPPPGLSAVLVLTLAETLSLLLGSHFWMLLLWVILGWIGQGRPHPFMAALDPLLLPLLRPLRRLLPSVAGLDFSPLLLMLALLLLRLLLVAPLTDLALRLSTITQ